MSVSCPLCAAPLDVRTRALLAPPPDEAVATSAAATTLFVLSAAFCPLGVVSALNDHADAGGSTAYQLGYRIGHFVLPAILLAAGLTVRAAARRRRERAMGTNREERRAHRQWQLHVWQAAWLCRRCRVAFIPAGALRPGCPASPAVGLEHFPQWIKATAEHPFASISAPETPPR
ncbi:hypothetical protein [Streptomyces rubellomurinus]|uniref:Uncharacterized protein n=1 Tax=Streptomyces rubellomurinus (strain ATCC 31215) TaxID=359131 RepID=A0A0F2TB11_STRR3|nr:hypothetical protein [Streptomyces rubellomurinus]KJS59646.1 hypothetical protein VM95_25765 [Streptomyces rubellomurinus]